MHTCMSLNELCVSRLVYPVFLSPPHFLTSCNQYAFRPTGSTIAAAITLLRIIIDLFSTDHHVLVVSLDFSKAFEKVRHRNLLEKNLLNFTF